MCLVKIKLFTFLVVYSKRFININNFYFYRYYVSKLEIYLTSSKIRISYMFLTDGVIRRDTISIMGKLNKPTSIFGRRGFIDPPTNIFISVNHLEVLHSFYILAHKLLPANVTLVFLSVQL
jgi:hypothetical protein